MGDPFFIITKALPRKAGAAGNGRAISPCLLECRPLKNQMSSHPTNMLYSTGFFRQGATATSTNFAVHVKRPLSHIEPMLFPNISIATLSAVAASRRLLHPLLRLHSSRRRCFGIAQRARGGKPELWFQGLRHCNGINNNRTSSGFRVMFVARLLRFCLKCEAWIQFWRLC